MPPRPRTMPGRSAPCRERWRRSPRATRRRPSRSIRRAQLAEHAEAFDGVARDGADRRHQPERDGKVVMTALLGEIGGSEIDGDAFRRQPEPDRVSAPRTRSRLSATALSGRPTMVKAGSPGPIWTCTSTARASIPSKATVVTRANIAKTPVPSSVTLAKAPTTGKNNQRTFPAAVEPRSSDLVLGSRREAVARLE